MLDSEKAMTEVPVARRLRADIFARAGDDRFVEMAGDRGGTEVPAGQVRGQFDLAQEGEAEFVRQARLARRTARR